MSMTNTGLTAAIDIGSTFMRLVIAEKTVAGTIRILERSIRGVPFAKEILRAGRISSEAVEQCAEGLRLFVRQLDEYRIPFGSVKAVVIASLRGAENCDAVVDRLTIVSGIPFALLDPGQPAYYYHLALRMLPGRNAVWGDKGVAVLEVGGLASSLLYGHDGEIRFTQSFNIGSLRIREQLDLSGMGQNYLPVVTEGRIREMTASLRQNLPAASPGLNLLVMGREMRVAASHLKKSTVDFDSSRIMSVPLSVFRRFVTKVVSVSPADLAGEWNIPYADAELVAPALCVVLQTAEALELRKVFISDLSFSDGLIVEASAGPEAAAEMLRQVIRTAEETGLKFRHDRKHARKVADNALALFDLLQPEHACSPRFRILLETAALLHDVGVFINARGHHKHSQYLIRNTEFIGLTQDEIQLTALVARYHRKSPPKITHPEYAALSRIQRLLVGKLAAILRVADALDRVHDQSLGKVTFELTPTELLCRPSLKTDTHAEQIALSEKSDLFNLIYGRSCRIVGE